MPGTPPNSPRFGAPRYSDADDATFAEQVNPITDTFDSLACRIDDARLTDARTPLPNSVTLASIADGTITGAKLAAATVTQAQLATGSVGSAQIIDGTIANADMASNSVDSRVIAPGGVVTAVIADGAVTQAKLSTAISQTQNLTGDLITSVAASRAGCVLCDGRAYSRTDPTYSALFALIGTKYGAGDGASTYNVPNLTGCTVVAADPGGSRLPVNHPAVGALFGSESATIAVGELPSHAHGVSDPTHAHSIADPGHSHGVAEQFWVNNAQGAPSMFGQGSWPMYIAAGPATTVSGTGIGIYGAATGIGIQNTGNGQPHANCPPSFAANVFIKL